MTVDKFERSEDNTLGQGQGQGSSASNRMLEETQVREAQQLLAWGKNNFGRFDLSGDRRLNFGEIREGMRNADSDLDAKMLAKLAEKYDTLKDQNSGMFGHKDSLNIGDLEKNVKVAEETARKAEEARVARAQLEKEQGVSRELMGPLMATADGDPQRSLFKVLDDSKGNRPDDKVSKSDLERFVKEYDRRTNYGDVGNGVYTADNRAYVAGLIEHWNSPEVVRLRGTYKDARDGREIANGTISLDSLTQAGGFRDARDIYSKYNTHDEATAARQRHTESGGIAYAEPPSFTLNKPRVTESADAAQRREQELARLSMANEKRDWASNNFGRYDITGDRKWTQGELYAGSRHADTDVDKSGLNYYMNNWNGVAHKNNTRISMDDINRHAKTQAEMFEQSEQARRADLAARQAQAEAAHLMAPLMATNSGQVQDSLFGVIDGLKGGHDDKIDKGDLKNYLKEFDRRARHGDIGASHFTMQDRQYVQYLVDNWDNGDVVALRGTTYNYNQDRDIPNGKITLSSLRTAAALDGDPFRRFRAQPEGDR